MQSIEITRPFDGTLIKKINGVKLSIEHLSQIKGEQIPMGQTAASVNRLAFTVREPIGVVASISAFNHPLAGFSRSCGSNRR